MEQVGAVAPLAAVLSRGRQSAQEKATPRNDEINAPSWWMMGVTLRIQIKAFRKIQLSNALSGWPWKVCSVTDIDIRWEWTGPLRVTVLCGASYYRDVSHPLSGWIGDSPFLLLHTQNITRMIRAMRSIAPNTEPITMPAIAPPLSEFGSESAEKREDMRPIYRVHHYVMQSVGAGGQEAEILAAVSASLRLEALFHKFW